MKQKLTIAAIALISSIGLLTTIDAKSNNTSLTITTWNIRNVSANSRDTYERNQIATILINYEMIAIQEVRDDKIIPQLVKHMNDWSSNDGYSCVVSKKVGRSRHKERYAYIWKTNKVEHITTYIYSDPGDKIAREPFIGIFRAGNFDFALTTIHIIFGKSKALRFQEIEALEKIRHELKHEKDIIFLGDFNLNAIELGRIFKDDNILNGSWNTTIGNKSQYDNIIITDDSLLEYASNISIYNFDENFTNTLDLKAISRHISDHRPVSALFYMNKEDDD